MAYNLHVSNQVLRRLVKNLKRLVANLIKKAKRAFANTFAPMSLQTTIA